MIGITRGFLKKFFYSKTESDASLALKANTTTVNSALALKANLASPALTGTPTAPTQANTTNNTSIASTAFVKTIAGGTAIPAVLKAQNGYMKLANGLILQWGYNTTIFPIAFPTACLEVFITIKGPYGTTYAPAWVSATTTNFTKATNLPLGNYIVFFAIGY